jgi:dTDP-glucose 4,6-dehydratase
MTVNPLKDSQTMTILVTGCAGFIGSNFVHTWLSSSDETVVNLDKLTYAGNLANLDALKGDPRHIFVQGDIGDRALAGKLLAEHKPRAVLNFAAESHVDRSIHGPGDFIETNVVGTFNLLESVRAYWQDLPVAEKEAFRFLHVSTDEVYGTLSPTDPPFAETKNYEPNSPYSASKADSFGVAQRLGWEAIAHLWRWPASARLAVCRRPLPRHCSRIRGRQSGRDLQHWRLEREAKS